MNNPSFVSETPQDDDDSKIVEPEIPRNDKFPAPAPAPAAAAKVVKPKSTSILALIWRGLCLISIEPLLMCHMISLLITALVFNDFALDRACRVNFDYPDDTCDALAARQTANYTEEETEIQKYMASLTTWRFAIEYSCPVFLVLMLGSWSDAHGRKFPLILVIGGNVLKTFGLVACVYYESWSVTTVTLIFTLISSLTGSYPLLSMAFHAYIADTTAEDYRTVRFGIAGAFITFGVSIGTAFGGFLLSNAKLGFTRVLCVSGGIELLVLVAAVCFIRNTKAGVSGGGGDSDGHGKTPSNGDTDDDAANNPIAAIFTLRHLLDAVKTVLRPRKNFGRLKLLLLLLVFFCSAAPAYGESSFIYLFVRLRFNWDAGQYGFFAMYQSLSQAIGVLLAMGILSYLLKVRDPYVGFMGCISQISSCFMYAFARTTTMLYAAPVVDIMNGSMAVCSRSMVSKAVDKDELGKIISLMAAIDCVNPFVANLIYGGLYRATLEILPGAFFLLSAGLAIPPIIVFGVFSYKDFYKKQI